MLKFLLVNGQKSSIERERHGQSFLRFGSTEVMDECCMCVMYNSISSTICLCRLSSLPRISVKGLALRIEWWDMLPWWMRKEESGGGMYVPVELVIL